MNNLKNINSKTELRHLPATQMHQLIGLLDIKDNWKQLAATIPNPDRPDELLFKTTDISILEEQRKRPGGSSSNSLLQHWSTYGRKRHTLGDAVYFLEKCGLARAAEIIKSCWIIEEDDQKHQHHLQAHNPNILINDSIQKTSNVHNWNDLPEYTSFVNQSNLTIRPSCPNESIMSFSTASHIDHCSFSEDNSLIRFNYINLQLATDNFSQKGIDEGGTKLGEGSFGEVFLCSTVLLNHDRLTHSKFVAVKRFKQLPINDSEDHSEFLSELNIMYHFQHPNLVKLYGYSDDGPNLCIVTEYLANGSLYNYLFCAKRPLTFRQRLKIITDIADAIVYLHTYSCSIDKNNSQQQPIPYIHRDIKSANILLDNSLHARLGDLGLVRQGSTSNMETTIVTKTVKGTSVYMAPEAFRGDVSVKVDTFSFGVVSLELWTGMAAFDAARDETDMVSHIDEIIGDEFDQLNYSDYEDLISLIDHAHQIISSKKINEILDKNCQDWNEPLAQKLVILAKCCIEQRKRNRPTMVEVRKALKHLRMSDHL